LATLSDFATVKALLGLTQANVSGYPGLNEIMTSVDDAVANFLQRDITQAERSTDYFAVDATRMIPLRSLPVASVASVVVTDSSGSDTTLTADQYQITSYGLRLATPISESKVAVTCTGGPSVPPSNWLRAGQIQVRHEWQTRDHVSAEAVQTDGGSVTRPGLVLLDEVKRLLSLDRHPLFTLMGSV
jgi:hypothetical protein